jgi:hypothetical protein
VIVVDDGGSDPLDRVIAGFSTEMSVRLIQQSNGGPAKGRNSSADVAQNEFLASRTTTAGRHRAGFPPWRDACSDRPRPGWRPHGQWLRENPYTAASQHIPAYYRKCYVFYNADPEQAQFFATNNLAARGSCFGSVEHSAKTSVCQKGANFATVGGREDSR